MKCRLFACVFDLKSEGNTDFNFVENNWVADSYFSGEPRSLLEPHFIQLIVENTGLQAEKRCGETTDNSADNNKSTRPFCNYSRPIGYFTVGIIFVLLGCFLAGYGATYGSNEKYQARQYIIETLISFGLIVVAFLSVAQGTYLIYLADTYHRSEDIGIEPIIIPELKLGNVQRHERIEMRAARPRRSGDDVPPGNCLGARLTTLVVLFQPHISSLTASVTFFWFWAAPVIFSLGCSG